MQQVRASQAARRLAYAKRLGERLRQMGKGEIWRAAYAAGYKAAWRNLKDKPWAREAGDA